MTEAALEHHANDDGEAAHEVWRSLPAGGRRDKAAVKAAWRASPVLYDRGVTSALNREDLAALLVALPPAGLPAPSACLTDTEHEWARRAADELVTRDPSDTFARALRAALRERDGDHQGAIEDCAAIALGAPEYVRARVTWAAALGGLGRFMEGLRKLNEATGAEREVPGFAALREGLWDAYFASKRDPGLPPRLPGKPLGLVPPIRLRGPGPSIAEMILEDRR
ncbi:MAG: hypothetical protein ACKVVT_00845 [Dehalococcoidia bacterium]